jgi:hypothetical protein
VIVQEEVVAWVDGVEKDLGVGVSDAYALFHDVTEVACFKFQYLLFRKNRWFVFLLLISEDG